MSLFTPRGDPMPRPGDLYSLQAMRETLAAVQRSNYAAKLMSNPETWADRYALLWSAHVAHLACKRAARR